MSVFLLTWVPIFLGLVAAAVVATIFCPVPRSHPISASTALLVSAIYLLATTSVTGVILAVARRRSLLSLCAVAAWLAPVAAFYTRGSYWAVSLACVLAVLAATTIRQIDIDEEESRPFGLMVLAAMLLQLMVVAILSRAPRQASLFACGGVFLIAWFSRTKPRGALRSAAAVVLAFLFVAASFMPYLIRPKWADGVGYPLLLAAFGDPGGTIVAQGDYGGKPPVNNVMALVPGTSYSGMILRPPIDDPVIFVPPSRRQVVKGNPNGRKVDPVVIPFYGAYWFFRASDWTLPSNAVESRGERTSQSFRSTDFSPIAMQARQNFGTLIEFSCCKAIEVVLSNGDRRPDTVDLELVVRNTRLLGQPRVSLGILPVTSTLHWYEGDSRPPVPEVLAFSVPAQPKMPSFDEAILRFVLRTPRQKWSAKIAIEKFRLIPHAF